MTNSKIAKLIDKYHLIAHPEGGFYSEQFRSEHTVESPIANVQRPAMTHIYFLLTAGQVSRWHRVMHDEIWNVYEGAPLRIMTFNEGRINDMTLSDKTHFFHVVNAGHYQAAETTGEYTLLGCSVAPGFDFADFCYVEDDETEQQIEGLGHDYAKFL